MLDIKWKCISFPLEKKSLKWAWRQFTWTMNPQMNGTKSTIQTLSGLCHDSVCVRQKELWRNVRPTEKLSITTHTKKKQRLPFRDAQPVQTPHHLKTKLFICYWKSASFSSKKRRDRWKLLGQRCHITIMMLTEKQKLESCHSWNDQAFQE